MTQAQAVDYHASAGYRLRCAREQESLSMRDVASVVNLLVSHVRAIEANRCDALAQDEQFLRRLRDYATLVDLNANDVVDSYRTQSEALAEPIQPLLAEPKQRDTGAWLGVAALALAFVGATIWLFNQTLPSETSTTATQRSEITEDKQPQAQRLQSKDQTTQNTGIEGSAAAARASTDAANAVAVPPMIDRHEATLAGGKENTRANDKTGAQPQRTAREQGQEQIATAQASAIASIDAKQAGTSTPLRSTEWFTSLDPDRYTLQILSLTREVSARAFIQSHQLEGEAAYFAVRKNDKTWFAITYGLYESYQAAESAAKSLPKSINNLKPWVRNTGRIQQSMRR